MKVQFYTKIHEKFNYKLKYMKSSILHQNTWKVQFYTKIHLTLLKTVCVYSIAFLMKKNICILRMLNTNEKSSEYVEIPEHRRCC